MWAPPIPMPFDLLRELDKVHMVRAGEGQAVRYYVVNDLGKMNLLHVATSSPQYLVQAFVFPVWGVVADRVSRKRVLLLASMAACSSCWLMTIAPSIVTYAMTCFLAIFSDIGEPIREAMLRDLFCAADWESVNGGATGIKSRMAIVASVATAVATIVGVGILELDKLGLGFPNEYTLHKVECYGLDHCVPEGSFSMDGGWRIDGCLRLLFLMGTVVLTLDVFIVAFLLPETVHPQHQKEESVFRFVWLNWRDLKPWSNLKVLATSQLRHLMFILFLGTVVRSGGSTMFLCFYRRFEFDSLTMMVQGMLAGVTGWLTVLAVPKLVDKFGDLRGVWIPSHVLLHLFMVSLALMPSGSGNLAYIVWPLFAGPGFALALLTPSLLGKLIPSDVQGTFQTAKSFVFLITQGIFPWFWQGLFGLSGDMPYPMDAFPLWVALACSMVGTIFTIKVVWDQDPRQAILKGNALKAFWDSSYVQKGWYVRHGGSMAPKADTTGHAAPRAV
ncbi:unnamed protein product [Polarella glacialis]|uniref:Uncharacterized protein n=1 Tax=Polarella glacialis TaxID=89957 RepID=A0A813HMF2_POLGL|nr:unnamed protein product [Polarella glacialis]